MFLLGRGKIESGDKREAGVHLFRDRGKFFPTLTFDFEVMGIVLLMVWAARW